MPSIHPANYKNIAYASFFPFFNYPFYKKKIVKKKNEYIETITAKRDIHRTGRSLQTLAIAFASY